MVGNLDNFPKKTFHKGSSCESPSNPCSVSDKSKLEDNPNPIIGGIVKGIEDVQTLNDSRENPNNEIRLINNAPVPGILAALFTRFGDLLSIDVSLFPSPNCNDLPSDYAGMLYTSNLDLFEEYIRGGISSPFPENEIGNYIWFNNVLMYLQLFFEPHQFPNKNRHIHNHIE
jgi:hypothetical protein